MKIFIIFKNNKNLLCILFGVVLNFFLIFFCFIYEFAIRGCLYHSKENKVTRFQAKKITKKIIGIEKNKTIKIINISAINFCFSDIFEKI